MWDAMIDEGRRALREEVQAFVRWVPRELLLAMDADEVRYPREFVQEAARRGVLGSSLACLYSLVTIVGEAIALFGTEEHKERYLAPLMIWTGTNEIMNLIIQHEYTREVLGGTTGQRDSEQDAAEAGADEEKIYE